MYCDGDFVRALVGRVEKVYEIKGGTRYGLKEEAYDSYARS